MTESTAIERQRTAALEAVLGTGDMAQMIEATKRNVEVAIGFAREREYVTEYPIVRDGKRVGTRLWFHHPTWQLLGQSFGITAYTEGEPTETKPGTWQASAVAALIENGRIVGRAVGIASRTEAGKAKMADHHLSATAQTRAQRNALRSCLGAILIAAGYEISDPEAPPTAEQQAALHVLPGIIGWTLDQAHERAGVESFTELNREQASDLIDEWKALADEAAHAQDDVTQNNPFAGASAAGADSPVSPGADQVEAGDTLHGAAPSPASTSHVHDWQPVPESSPLASKRWVTCSICRRAVPPKEAQ